MLSTQILKSFWSRVRMKATKFISISVISFLVTFILAYIFFIEKDTSLEVEKSLLNIHFQLESINDKIFRNNSIGLIEDMKDLENDLIEILESQASKIQTSNMNYANKEFMGDWAELRKKYENKYDFNFENIPVQKVDIYKLITEEAK